MANIGGFVSKILPWIGAAASGNVPQLMSLAAQAVSTVTGKEVKATPDAIATAVANATPEQLLALKQADNDFQVKMATLNINSIEELLKLDADDRSNARAREIAIKDNTPRYLAYAVVAMTVLAEGFILIHGTPVGLDGVILGRILGTLDAALITVLTYYFGSSAGSHAKDDTVKMAVAQGVK